MAHKSKSTRRSDLLTVSNGNILEVIAALKFGSWNSETKRTLWDALLNHRLAHRAVSRQTINAWFQKKNKPSRGAALEFLNDFFRTLIAEDDLPDSLKTLHASVSSFFQRATAAAKASPGHNVINERQVHATGSGVIIRSRVDPADLVALTELLSGHFLAYRYRFLEDSHRPISREVLRLFRVERQLHLNCRIDVKITNSTNSTGSFSRWEFTLVSWCY